MGNYDFFLGDLPDSKILRSSISQLLGVPQEQVAVVDDIEGPIDVEQYPVIVERKQRDGDFPLFVSLYAYPDIVTLSEAEFVSSLSKVLECSGLFAFGSCNPYEWVLVTPAGSQAKVLLYDEPLDGRGEAFVCEPPRGTKNPSAEKPPQ